MCICTCFHVFSGPLFRHRDGAAAHVFQWQADCLMAGDGAVLKGERNLVFTAPTSAGKTLVAEILMLRALGMDPSRKAMLVLPYVALCREKAERLSRLLAPMDREVKNAYGGYHTPYSFNDKTGVIVCTIENANS